jgi:ElaB/YqjD/DUF883 family membrane-anchored ribosome-binding protein
MGSHKKEISQELAALRENVTALADELTGLLSETGDEVAGEIGQRMRRIRDGFNEALSRTTTTGRDLAQNMNVDGLSETLENSVKERPLMMLAIAAGIGAVVASQLRR